MPGQNTIEYLTIQHCRERIQLAIQNDLVAISGRMVEKGLITIDDSTDTTNLMYNKSTLANRLILNMLLPRVQENEKNYQVFINDILGANSYYYSSIIDHLKTVYEGIIIIILKMIMVIMIINLQRRSLRKVLL